MPSDKMRYKTRSHTIYMRLTYGELKKIKQIEENTGLTKSQVLSIIVREALEAMDLGRIRRGFTDKIEILQE